MTTIDNAGNSFSTARRLSLTSANQTVTDFVGANDWNDYYRFSLSSRSSVNLTLGGLTANADIQIIQDRNSNGIFDPSTEVIVGSFSSTTTTKWSGMTANAGTYFIRVFSPTGANTNYNLGFSAFPVSTNIAPMSLQFGLEKTAYTNTETLKITSPWVFDHNGAADISRVDFRIKRADGTFLDIADTGVITPGTGDNRWGSFTYSLNLAGLNLASGNYSLWAQAFDRSGTVSNVVEQQFNLIVPNIAPNSLAFNLNNTSVSNTGTLNITGGRVSDANGVRDISLIDFQILQNGVVRNSVTNDVFGTSIVADSFDNRWGSFSHNLSLSGLNLGAGSYTLRAVARDRSGAVSNIVERGFNINAAPQDLQFGLDKTTYTNTETLRITNPWVFDHNGATDISRVDFRIRRADGIFIDVADATVTPASGGWASFTYSLNLAGLNLAGGNYSLWAQAFDRSGAVSNIFERGFSLIINDWFSINLKDEQIRTLARNLAGDRDLSRWDMLNIFESAKDFLAIDANESSDLKTLVNNLSGTPFSIQQPVRWLAGKVAEGAFVNMIASQFQANLVDRWFLGKVAPTARFDEKNGTATTTYNFTYVQLQGNLYGSSGRARIGDIDQGRFGSCAFLAALSATFGRQSSDAGNAISSIIDSMILDNGDNTYTIRFFNSDRNAEYVTVDRQIATYKGQLFGARANGSTNPYATNNIIWVSLVERAYAQWREWREGQPGYNLMGNGDNLSRPLTFVSGKAANDYATSNISFSMIETALRNGQAINTARIGENTNLIIGYHAYSITNAYLNSSGQQRIVMRNPWGVDGYSWQTKSGVDDGFIDMSFDEFRGIMNYGVSIA